MQLAIAAIVLFCATSASAEQVLRYSVVFSGTTNGTQTTTVGDDGRIVVDYTYRNNGRGPDLREETVLADDGTQVSYSAKGKSTFGSPIDETFERADERGSWQTLAGRGVIETEQPAVYVPESILSECSPESTAVITHAVLSSPSRGIAALPGGTLSAQKLKDTSIETADGHIGVSLYALHGLTTHPVLVWLTSDDSHRLLASISPGNRQIVLAGSESHGERLEKLQIEADRGDYSMQIWRGLESVPSRLTQRLNLARSCWPMANDVVKARFSR